jgi:ParB family chromosome partitioning protein
MKYASRIWYNLENHSREAVFMALFTKNRKQQILDLSIDLIHPNPYQPRKHFSQEELESLAHSIAQVGILQPLVVRRTSEGWELIAGERRLRAAKLAGLQTVPCLSMEADEESSSLLALVENLLRSDLDVWEEAYALRKMIDQFHLSQEEAGQKIGLSQSAVANKLRLLKLPQDVIDTLRQAGLTERHARALLRLPTEELQRKAAAHMIRYQLNVAGAEAYVDKLYHQSKTTKRAVPIYRTKDVRLFLNTIQRGLSIMQSAGVAASLGREETDREITLTIHIPK